MKAVVFTALLLYWITNASCYDPNPDSLKTFILPTVKVIVHKPSEAIGGLQIIHSSEKKDALNLREALSQNVGISATTGSKDESNLRLRGFRKNEVKIMIDGRPLNSGYFGNVDLGKLSMLHIAEIQVIKGPASPLFGSNSMGGVVNLITREPSPETWLQLSALIKRNNTQELKISSAHSFDTFSYQLGFAREHTDGFMLSDSFVPTPFENGEVRNSSAKTQYNLMGNIGADLFTFHKLGFDFGYSGMDKKELPASIYERRIRFYEDWKRYHATASGEFNLSEAVLLSSMVSFDGGGDRYLEYVDPLLQNLNVDSRMQNQSFGFAPRLRWQMGNNQTWDYGYRYEIQTNKRKDTTDYPSWIDNSIQTHFAFTQYELQTYENLIATAAVGIIGSMNDQRQQLNWNLDPAVGLVFNQSNNIKTSFAAGRNTAQPTLRQLYSYQKGNPMLKPQSSLKFELSHERSLIPSTLSTSGSIFYNHTRDLIDLLQGRFANIYRIQSYGGEGSFILSPLSWWSFTAEYAYLDYLGSSDYRLTESPRHSINLSHLIALPSHSSLHFSSHFQGQRFSQDSIGTYHILGAYWRHDTMLTIPWKKHSLQLGMENILDTDYQGEYGFPEAGRNFSVGITTTI